jgi:hypothetical protein
LANKLSDYVQTYFEPEHKSDREFQKWIDNIMCTENIKS